MNPHLYKTCRCAAGNKKNYVKRVQKSIELNSICPAPLWKSDASLIMASKKEIKLDGTSKQDHIEGTINGESHQNLQWDGRAKGKTHTSSSTRGKFDRVAKRWEGGLLSGGRKLRLPSYSSQSGHSQDPNGVGSQRFRGRPFLGAKCLQSNPFSWTVSPLIQIAARVDFLTPVRHRKIP